MSQGPEIGGKVSTTPEEKKLIFEIALERLRTPDLASADAGLALLEASDAKEKEVTSLTYKYEGHKLGEYSLPTAPAYPTISPQNGELYYLAGGVDRVKHNKKASREGTDADAITIGGNLYGDKQAHAKSMLGLLDYVDFKDGFEMSDAEHNKMKSILKSVAAMTEFTDVAWDTMIADKKYTDEEIYGEKGVYNVLLAYQRALSGFTGWDVPNVIPLTEDFREKTVKIGTGPETMVVPPLYSRINLSLSKKKGNVAKDRYTMLLEMKREKVTVAPVAPTPTLTPGPTPTPTPPTTPTLTPGPTPAPAKVVSEVTETLPTDLADAIKALEAGGFTLVNRPKQWGDTVYAKYDKTRRLNIKFNKGGTYDYELLARPAGRDSADGRIKGGTASVDAIKAGVAKETVPSDPFMVMELDLRHVSVVETKGTIKQTMKVTSVTPDTAKPGLYMATVHVENYVESSGRVCKPFDVTVRIEGQSNGAMAGDVIEMVKVASGDEKRETMTVKPIAPGTDVTEFVKNAVQMGYNRKKVLGKIELM